MSDESKKKPAAEEGSQEATPESEAEAAAARKARKKKKILLIGGILALLILVGGGAGAFMVMKGKKAEGEKAEAVKEASGKPAFYALGDMVVNLGGEGKHPHYLKVKVSLELVDEKDLPLIESIKPRIIDNFQLYLRELRVEDLRGSAGMYRLRQELLMRVTEAAQPVRVRDVLFQEMLVQ